LYLDYKEPSGCEEEPFSIKASFETPWLEKNENVIPLIGNDLDIIYANIVQMMSGRKLLKRDTLAQSVRDYLQMEQLQEQIDQLTKKKDQMVQVNKLFDLRREISELQDILQQMKES